MNLEAEQEMWDAVVDQDRRTRAGCEAELEAGGIPQVESGRTKRGTPYVVLSEAVIAATANTGMVKLETGENVIWYGLGKPFARNGETCRYGYLDFDRAVAQHRQAARDRAAWSATTRPAVTQ